ncbi:MAG: HNH endonuclease signature motif containing protein [Acidimicrobiaceae bacterium]|nr:HNH endonuclease signature motif containing protein [Acidimicrobiaceae bacterium]
MVARDQHCIGCEANPLWCRAHHIIWWRNGGATDLDNLVLVCDDCHHKIHDHGWQVHRHPDTGKFHLKSPATRPVPTPTPAKQPSLNPKSPPNTPFTDHGAITITCRPPPTPPPAEQKGTGEQTSPNNRTARSIRCRITRSESDGSAKEPNRIHTQGQANANTVPEALRETPPIIDGGQTRAPTKPKPQPGSTPTFITGPGAPDRRYPNPVPIPDLPPHADPPPHPDPSAHKVTTDGVTGLLVF